MKPFADLTERGQGIRLRALAATALQNYNINVLGLQLLTNHYNAIFRVDATTGERYVLRINLPDHRTQVDIRSEMLWLSAIRKDTDITVPAPIANIDGGFVTTCRVAEVPEARHCALFSWIGGRKPNRQPSMETIRRHGATMAQLHSHAERFHPPDDFTSRRQDRVWTFGKPSEIIDETNDMLLSSRQQAVFQEAAERAQIELDSRYRNTRDLRFLHADLHLGNIKIRRGEIQVLDFDDSCWCFPEQDIGIALFYFQSRPDYRTFRDAFLSGYTGCRPLPGPEDGLIETARHARGFEVAGFVARTDNPAIRALLPDLLDDMEPQLRVWLGS